MSNSHEPNESTAADLFGLFATGWRQAILLLGVTDPSTNGRDPRETSWPPGQPVSESFLVPGGQVEKFPRLVQVEKFGTSAPTKKQRRKHRQTCTSMYSFGVCFAAKVCSVDA